MNDGAVLNVRTLANDDFVGVAAQHTAIPNGSVFTHLHIAANNCAGRDKGAFVDDRFFVANGEDEWGHGASMREARLGSMAEHLKLIALAYLLKQARPNFLIPAWSLKR